MPDPQSVDEAIEQTLQAIWVMVSEDCDPAYKYEHFKLDALDESDGNIYGGAIGIGFRAIAEAARRQPEEPAPITVQRDENAAFGFVITEGLDMGREPAPAPPVRRMMVMSPSQSLMLRQALKHRDAHEPDHACGLYGCTPVSEGKESLGETLSRP